MSTSQPDGSGPRHEQVTPPVQPQAAERSQRRRLLFLSLLVLLVAGVTFGVTALLVTIFEHRQEARTPFVRLVEVDEVTTDPVPWGTWRLDFISSENSMGFHADQEAVRILGESIDYCRQAQALALRLRAPDAPAVDEPGEPVQGVTPTDRAPPAPYKVPRTENRNAVTE